MSATAATPLTRNARADRIFANANAIADAICDANWFAMIGSPQLAKARRAFDAGLADFNQLHNSLNGGSAGHGGIDRCRRPGRYSIRCSIRNRFLRHSRPCSDR